MLTELLDLKKDRVKGEVVQLTRAQTELVHLVMSEVRARMLKSLMAVVAGIEPKGSAEEVNAAIRTRIGAEFSTMFAEATEPASEAKDIADEVKAAIRTRIGAEISTMHAGSIEGAIEAKDSETATVNVVESPHGEQRFRD